MSKLLTKMLAQLSEQDKVVFNELSIRLKQVDGDISQLNNDEITLIKSMETKYGEQLNQAHKTENDQLQQSTTSNNSQSIDILETPFAQHVRQLIARDLGNEFPLEEDAVAYVFDNKWLPIDCKEPSLASDLFKRFKLDIEETNQWRQDLGDNSKDKMMAVGMTWFMVVFQMHKRLNEA